MIGHGEPGWERGRFRGRAIMPATVLVGMAAVLWLPVLAEVGAPLTPQPAAMTTSKVDTMSRTDTIDLRFRVGVGPAGQR